MEDMSTKRRTYSRSARGLVTLGMELISKKYFWFCGRQTIIPGRKGEISVLRKAWMEGLKKLGTASHWESAYDKNSQLKDFLHFMILPSFHLISALSDADLIYP